MQEQLLFMEDKDLTYSEKIKREVGEFSHGLTQNDIAGCLGLILVELRLMRRLLEVK